jgi:HSP20 family protein
MDLREDKENHSVTATFELPGMKKEDVQIDLQTTRLTISGETKTSTEREEQGGWAVRER